MEVIIPVLAPCLFSPLLLCAIIPPVVTKRQLGIFLALAGLAVVGGTVAVDWIGAGEWSGFGPLQWIGLGAGLLAVAVAAALIRIGHRPA